MGTKEPKKMGKKAGKEKETAEREKVKGKEKKRKET